MIVIEVHQGISVEFEEDSWFNQLFERIFSLGKKVTDWCEVKQIPNTFNLPSCLSNAVSISFCLVMFYPHLSMKYNKLLQTYLLMC